MDKLFYSPIDPQHIKRERSKARSLKQSQWWKHQVALGICYYCEKKFPKSEVTMDHILAIGRGGCSTKGNVVVACKPCNSKKAHQTPAEILLSSLSEPLR